MKDEKILGIRVKVFEIFSIAEDNFYSASILYESEKHRTDRNFQKLMATVKTKKYISIGN